MRMRKPMVTAALLLAATGLVAQTQGAPEEFEAVAVVNNNLRSGVGTVLISIDRWSTDFSYCVSVTGVTGARAELGQNGTLDRFLTRVKQNTTKPFVVGFGISNADQVRKVWQFADGAVIGSALLRILEQSPEEDAIRLAALFFKSLRPS